MKLTESQRNQIYNETMTVDEWEWVPCINHVLSTLGYEDLLEHDENYEVIKWNTEEENSEPNLIDITNNKELMDRVLKKAAEMQSLYLTQPITEEKKTSEGVKQMEAMLRLMFGDHYVSMFHVIDDDMRRKPVFQSQKIKSYESGDSVFKVTVNWRLLNKLRKQLCGEEE